MYNKSYDNDKLVVAWEQPAVGLHRRCHCKTVYRAYTEPTHKNPDIRIWREKVAENPDLPKWNGYANTMYIHGTVGL